jgi:parvulin-like peptidyl-prolyl isomerase
LKRTLYFILIISAAILAACVAGDTTPPQGSTDTAVEQSVPDVVARVNGSDITRADYERAVTRLNGASALAQTVSDQVINTLIEQRIIEQAASELNVAVTAEDVDTEINALKDLTGDWNAWLTENGYTEPEFRDAIRSNLLTQRVREAVLAQTGDVNTIRTVHARHILVATQAEADAVLQRLNNGETFEALAAEVSRDVTTRDTGGDLGFFTRDDLTTPQLADLAFTLGESEMAGPVQTALGWHIVQTIEFGEEPVASGSEALALEQRFAQWLAERRQSATIEVLF